MTLYCPFCRKQTISAFHQPSYRGVKSARGSGVSHSFNVGVGEEYTILSGCSICGKDLKQVKKELGW